MMNYLIDTNILIEIENNNQNIIMKVNELKKAPLAELYISIFSFCEFYYGIMEKNTENKEKVKERLKQYKILTPTIETGILFCELLYKSEKKGRKMSQFDAFIAAIAMEQNCILITADEIFSSIPDLKTIILSVK